MYLGALEHGEHGIPNLERQLSESSALFMQAVGLTYKRTDDGEDPPEWRPHGSDGAASSIGTQTYQLLHKARRIPGTQDDGSINVAGLKAWITEVRALCKTYARELAGDNSIGELLAKSPVGADGVWPCEPVREALEDLGTKEIAEGMVVGVYNARGAHFRSPGGDQERDLASKYRGWSRQTAFQYPFVSRFLEQVAQTYDRDAEWHDTDANIRNRLTY